MQLRTVLIINLSDTGNEAEALRQTLERMNYFVCMKNIGRPNDFLYVLKGETPLEFDSLIISCHGDDGKICMPVLADFVYLAEEPRGNLSAEDVSRHLALSGKTILNLGCTTGRDSMAAAFSKNNTYLAPRDYVEGSATLFFAIRLFYELASKQCDIKTAYTLASESDDETRLFCLYQDGAKQ